MLRNVYLKSLRDMRRSIVWWSLGLIAMTALMIAVYPTIRDNPDLNKLVENYPEALKAFIAFGGDLDYTSGAGYLGSELFAFMVPLLLSIAAIGAGARATAGEEEGGTIDLLLANPVSRQRLVFEKAAALATEVVLLAVVLWISLWWVSRSWEWTSRRRTWPPPRSAPPCSRFPSGPSRCSPER